MDLLLQYLNDKHKVSDLETLKVDFLDKFGVNVKTSMSDSSLFIFKYNQLAAKWLDPVTHQCRGPIFRHLPSGEWVRLSRPFNKFFNLDESHCPIFSDDLFNISINDLRLSEKTDGTCIQVWFDPHTKQWSASTLGMIEPTTINSWTNVTYSQLFWQLLGKDVQECLNPAFTYMFELCTEENRILTQYPDDRIYFLAIIPVEQASCDVDILAPAYLPATVYKPKSFHLTELGIQDKASLRTFVEQASRSDEYGKYPEGFVLYYKQTPIAKIKNFQYLELHGLSGTGNELHARNCAIEAFFGGRMDDLYSILTPNVRNFVDFLQNWYFVVQQEIMSAVSLIGATSYETQKEYALAVQTKTPPLYHSLFFQNKETILSGTFTSDTLDSWMQKYYTRFEELFKAEYTKTKGAKNDSSTV